MHHNVCAMCAQVVSRDIRRILTQRAFFFNIVLDDVSITQLTFSKEYTHAVERKQVAQQDAERAKFIVSATSFALPVMWGSIWESYAAQQTATCCGAMRVLSSLLRLTHLELENVTVTC